MAIVTVTSASEMDRERSIVALVAAFVSDPFIRWMFPEPRQYLVYFPQVLKFFAGRAFDNQSAYRPEDLRQLRYGSNQESAQMMRNAATV